MVNGGKQGGCDVVRYETGNAGHGPDHEYGPPSGDGWERSGNTAERLPFTPDDATAGSENELQVAVIGARDAVDLPLTIQESSFYHNMVRRAASGDTSGRTLRELDRYLQTSEVWENSWVRFPLGRLNRFARTVLERDLLADKSKSCRRPAPGPRRFLPRHRWGRASARAHQLSMLKLALADFIGAAGRPGTGSLRSGRGLSGALFQRQHVPRDFFFLSRTVLPFSVAARAGAGSGIVWFNLSNT